jgi:hypothetical protein
MTTNNANLPPTFFACVGSEIIDHADTLPALLAILNEIWETGFGADVAVWQYPGRVLGSWCGLLEASLSSPGPGGGTVRGTQCPGPVQAAGEVLTRIAVREIGYLRGGCRPVVARPTAKRIGLRASSPAR